MKASSGRTIPDPPSDPIERSLWKTMYFADLYGASPETIQQMMATKYPQKRNWLNVFILVVSILNVCLILFTRRVCP